MEVKYDCLFHYSGNILATEENGNIFRLESFIVHLCIIFIGGVGRFEVGQFRDAIITKGK
jgi:hypothetical protein